MTATGGSPSADRTRHLAVAIAGASVVVFAGAALGERGRSAVPSGWAMLVVVAAYVIIGSRQMRLYFRQHRAAFTFTDVVLMTALFFVGPVWLGLAAGAGEIVFGLLCRTPALKVIFNSSTHAATAALAALAFSLLGGTAPAGPRSWMPALVALMCWTFLNAVSTVAVIARAEGERFERTLMAFLPTAVVTTALSASVGLLTVELLRSGPLYLLLLVPLSAVGTLNSRYAAIQRDEHLRVERLYETTERTAQLSADLDVVSSIADESRNLVTATAAICLLREGDGPWVARTARGARVTPGRAGDVVALLDHAAESYGTTLAGPVPEAFRALAPDADVMMVARAPRGAPVDLILAVFRERSGGRWTENGVGETLAAFAAHGAVLAANAGLVSELQRSLAAQLEANQRKDEFVATISHELRTPLTVMLGAAQTLCRLEGRLPGPDRRRLLDTAVDQGQRLKLLIEDLLLVAAAEKGDRRCDLVPVGTAQLVADLRRDVPHRHLQLVTFSAEPTGGEVLTDPFRLRQIVANLIQNSLKYAPGSAIEVTLRPAGSAVALSVVDHGPGIPAADRENVFDRFFQVDQSSTRAQGGTGLGLYICRKLADQLGAGLQLRDTEGGGCTFVLSLPRRSLRRSGDTPAPAAAPSGVPAVGMLRRPALAGSTQP